MRIQRFYIHLTIWLLLLVGMLSCDASADMDTIAGQSRNDYVEIALALPEREENGSWESIEPDENNETPHHVTQIHLYLYEEIEGGSLKRIYQTVRDYSEDKTEENFKLYLPNNLSPKAIYRFIATGVNGNRDTYTLHAPEIASTLSDICAELNEGKAVDQLFGGETCLTGAELQAMAGEKDPIRIELNRRVAGFGIHFSSYKYQRIVLRMSYPLNTKVSMASVLPAGYDDAASVPDAEYIDYINSPATDANGDILWEWISDGEKRNTRGPGGSGSGGSGSGDGNSDPTSINEAFYVLPARYGDIGEPMLYLDLYESANSENPVACKRVVMQVSEGSVDRYPLRANQFYRFGTEEAPIELKDSSSSRTGGMAMPVIKLKTYK